MKILLVDDEPTLFEDMLKASNYNFDVVQNGFQALHLLSLESQQYDLIIIDIYMPIINGWDVLKYIKENFEDTYVLMLTADSTEATAISSLNKGADVFLTKPISPTSFISHIGAMQRRLKKKGINQKQNLLLSTLSTREKEILKKLSQGYSNKKIAQDLSISEQTIKNHIANIYSKLNVKRRAQASYLLINQKLTD